MNSHRRTDIVFEEAKKLGLVNPMTDEGAPTRRMISEAISDAEGDAMTEVKSRLRGMVEVSESVDFGECPICGADEDSQCSDCDGREYGRHMHAERIYS